MRLVARPLEFRERTEEFERASLSTWATRAAETKGRDRHEDPDPLRTVFQVDVDRIQSSAAFRALAGKRAWLPVTGSPTRMQQAVLVARLAGLIARAARLNEDLATAIAYGHALGATPFAAAGEEALAVFLDGGYDRAAQAVRIVEEVEGDRAGLNLTWETRDGMLHHVWEASAPSTPEGQVVRVAARVVQVGWPVAEGLGAGILHPDDVPAAARRAVSTRDGFARVAQEVARDSVDRPDVVLGAQMEELVGVLAGVTARLERRSAAEADRHRAVHCLRSLAVYDLERLEASGGAVDLAGALTRLALATEAEILTRFRAAFEPPAEGPRAQN